MAVFGLSESRTAWMTAIVAAILVYWVLDRTQVGNFLPGTGA